MDVYIYIYRHQSIVCRQEQGNQSSNAIVCYYYYCLVYAEELQRHMDTVLRSMDDLSVPKTPKAHMWVHMTDGQLEPHKQA